MRGLGLRTTKKQVMDALVEAGGIMNDACKILGMSHSEFWRKWRHEPDVDALIRDLHRIGVARITDLVYQQALSGDIKSQHLYLRFCPEVKEQGWVEEQKITLKSDKPLTEEEKESLRNDLFGKV